MPAVWQYRDSIVAVPIVQCLSGEIRIKRLDTRTS